MNLSKYCRHKASGRAYVKVGGQRTYLGKFNTPESLARYNALLETMVIEGRAKVADQMTVSQLKTAYLAHCERYYRKPNGSPTGETNNIRGAFKYLSGYADELARDFGPRKLMQVQDAMVRAGVVRTNINRHTSRIVAMFKWGVKHELTPAATHQALMAVGGLRRGRSKAIESAPVCPVPEDDFEAALTKMTHQVAAMCRLMCLTGMRVSEARLMAWDSVDRTVTPWRYEPASHKTAHHGKRQVIFLGPQSQLVVRPFEAARGFVFRSSDLMNKPYTLAGLEASVYRACDKAGVDRWSPGRLRHNYATNIRAQFDLDAARVALGHSEATTTEIYAERDLLRAAEIARQVG